MRILLINERGTPGSFSGSKPEEYGFHIDEFRDICEGEAASGMVPYSAIILESAPDGEGGCKILRRWRRNNINHPVLVIMDPGTARIRADILNAGADDCMQAPVVDAEVAARLLAIIRRSHMMATPVLTHHGVSLDTGSRVVSQKGKVILLTCRETAILEIFLLNPGRVLTRAFLEAHQCTWHQDICSNVAEVHISRLRRKLGQDFIITVRGLGYRLNDKSEE